MADILFKKLYSEANLKLAFKRISTSQNVSYKNVYRNLLIAYEINLDQNISILSKQLKGGSYSPSPVTKFYIPKGSGLHRPISYLFLNDLIVYQSLVNLLAEKFRKKLVSLYGKTTFSNKLGAKNEIFFFEDWKNSYRNYLKKIKNNYDGGDRWVVHFDLAAYFDTINHSTLMNQISRGNSNEKFKDLLNRCLNEWSTHKKHKVGHGIPQGPISSALVGEMYLLPIDTQMTSINAKYVRYVDDIKIFGKTREEVLKNVLVLEKECKERGLIPQAKKFEVMFAETQEDAVGKKPSLTSENMELIFADESEAWELFKQSFSSKEIDVSRVRFILKSTPRNKYILSRAFKVMNDYPSLCDDFSVFFLNYKDRSDIAERIFEVALKKPSHFDYVESCYWVLLSKFLLSPTLKKRLSAECVKRIKSTRGDNVSLRYGLFTFLCSNSQFWPLKWLCKEKSSLIIAFVISSMSCTISDDKDSLDFYEKILNRTSFEPSMAMHYQILKASGHKTILQAIKNKIKPSQHLSRFNQSAVADPIGELLSSHFGVSNSNYWLKFMNTDYEHANHILHQAVINSNLDRNAWASYLDSFNDILVRKFIALMSPIVQAMPALVNRDGHNNDLGVLLDPNKMLMKNYSSIFASLHAFHKRRNTTPTSHAYDKKTRVKTIFIKTSEQKTFKKSLMVSYQNLLNEVAPQLC